MRRQLIIGNGGAAISAVKAIRSISPNDEITIISKESYLAYSPSLITYYLSGKIEFEDLFICDESFYQQNRVDIRLNRNVAKVVTKLKKVYLDRGEVLKYDNLLLATGAQPVIPPIEGLDLPGVFTLYTADDAREIVTFLEGKERVAVIGGGLVGLQTLGALSNSGKKTILVEMKDQILPQALDLQGARILEEWLRQKGVDIHLGQRVSGIYGGDSKKVISLASGNELMTDGVILAVGFRPKVDFLQGSGIELADGVIVDQYCRANKNGVYAAGDIVQAPDPLKGGRPTINACWPNAIKQGKVAGLNMAGKKVQLLQNVRYNAFTVFGLPCVSIGLIGAVNIQLEEEVSQKETNYRKLLFNDDILVGAILIGDVGDAGVIANIIERHDLFPRLQKTLRSHRFSTYSIKDYIWLKTNLWDLPGKDSIPQRDMSKLE